MAKFAGSLIRMRSISNEGMVKKDKYYNVNNPKTAAKHVKLKWAEIDKADSEMKEAIKKAKTDK